MRRYHALKQQFVLTKVPQKNGGKSKMIRGISLVAICFVASATGALAQSQLPPPSPFPNMFQGTPQEQAACRPDSQRFCREEIPDTFRVLACLQKNRQQISVSCRRVLESHGQ